MVTLNKPAAGDTDWATEINDNWAEVEKQLVAFQGRLQRDSATQVSIQRYSGDAIDVNGETISIGSSGILCTTTDNLINASGGDVGAGGMAINTLYYLYVSNASASPFPSDLRASTTPPNSLNGVKYLGTSGNAANWRFVGWVRTVSNAGTPEFRDDATDRLVANYYNRVRKHIELAPGYVADADTESYDTMSTTWTQANNGNGATASFIANGEDAISYVADAWSENAGGSNNRSSMGVGEDSTSTAAVSAHHFFAPGEDGSMACGRTYTPSGGYHTLDLLVATSGGTSRFYADGSGQGGTNSRATCLHAEVMV